MVEMDTLEIVPQAERSPARIDRVLAAIILILSLASYAYIFQGIGWNQMAHWGTIRSIVERGTPEITPFADITQDTMQLGKRFYSNKQPGLAMLGVPFYFVIFHVERWLGIAYDADGVWLKNLHAMTVLLCALPGAALNVLLYFAFRREGATPRASMLLAGGFAFGSLSLPYSGLFMSHNLCALLVFAAWYRLTGPTLRLRDALIAGAIIGYSNLCDPLTGMATLGLALYLVVRRTGIKYWFAYASGPCAAALTVLIYDRLAYGRATQISTLGPSIFYRPHLFLGLFDWPDFRRIYWISYQPMRGLFACCPEFVLCLFAPLLLLLQRKTTTLRLDLLVILPILAGYLLFYVTFYGWKGGDSIGPRYMIPVLPLLWMFALRPFQRWPIIATIAITLSIIYMLAITSVCAVDAAYGDNAPPNNSDPVCADLIVFMHGRVTDVWMSETLGGLMGVPKNLLIVPFLLPVVAYFCTAFALPRSPPGRTGVNCAGYSPE
jgi:hypothetical protein